MSHHVQRGKRRRLRSRVRTASTRSTSSRRNVPGVGQVGTDRRRALIDSEQGAGRLIQVEPRLPARRFASRSTLTDYAPLSMADVIEIRMCSSVGVTFGPTTESYGCMLLTFPT